MALGAQRSDVLGLVVRQGMTLAAIGVVAGLAGAFSLTRVMASLLFNVRPDDPTTYLAISFLLIVVAFLACYLPARRAAKLDPCSVTINRTVRRVRLCAAATDNQSASAVNRHDAATGLPHTASDS